MAELIVMSERMVRSLGVAALHSLATIAIVLVILVMYGRRKLSTVDWLTLLWLVYDAIVHLTLVGARSLDGDRTC